MYVEHIQALQNRARKNVDEDAGLDVDVHRGGGFMVL